MTDRAQLAVYIAALLKDEPNGLPCGVIARRLGMRDSDVRAVLRADPWFARTGEHRYSRWHLCVTSSAVLSDADATGRVGRVEKLRDALADALRRLDVLEARVDAQERQNGARP